MTTLALIGVGRWGKNYIKTIEKIPGVHVKYLCAKSTKSLNPFPDTFVKTTDYRRLAAYGDIDGIIIATPASTHYKMERYFLEKGRNILVEKPLATNYHDARKLKAVSKKSICMVGHIYLYHPAIIKVLQLMKSFHTIDYIDIVSCDWGPIRANVDALWDWATHDVSTSIFLLGKEPLAVSGWTLQNGSMIFLRLVFPNNVQAFIKAGALSPVKKRQVTIVSKSQALIFDDIAEKKITRFKEGNPVFYPTYKKQEPLMEEILAFVGAITSGKPPKSDLYEGLRVTKVLHFAQKSLRKNGALMQIPHDENNS